MDAANNMIASPVSFSLFHPKGTGIRFLVVDEVATNILCDTRQRHHLDEKIFETS